MHQQTQPSNVSLCHDVLIAMTRVHEFHQLDTRVNL